MIQIPIEIGDVIRVGKFKNKRITVKEISTDEYGLPTCNGKGILKIRIEKLMPPKEPKQENNMNNNLKEAFSLSSDGKMLIDKLKDDLNLGFIYLNQNIITFNSKNVRYAEVEKVNDKLIEYGFKTEIIKVPYSQANTSWTSDPMGLAIKIYTDFHKVNIKENNMNKPNKAKLDKMIFEALHSNDTQVKIKQKDKLWWIQQEETDECLNAVGFDSKEAAEHSALTKGYSFPKSDEFNEVESEILTSKIEKTKGVDKVETMKLDKEKEIKLEILRIAKRVIREELSKKKVKLTELEVTDPDKVKKMEEMARLSDSFDRLKAEMEKIKKQLDPLDEEITKWMDEADAAGERALETKNILITIKRKGNPNAEVAAYKERFERLYSRVNGALKKQEDEFWAATRKFKVVPTSIGVQYKKQENAMNEDNILTQGWDKIKSFFSNLYNKVIQYGKVADQGIAELHKLTGV